MRNYAHNLYFLFFQTNGGPGSFTPAHRASEGVGGGGGGGGGVNTPSGANDIYQG